MFLTKSTAFSFCIGLHKLLAAPGPAFLHVGSNILNTLVFLSPETSLCLQAGIAGSSGAPRRQWSSLENYLRRCWHSSFATYPCVTVLLQPGFAEPGLLLPPAAPCGTTRTSGEPASLLSPATLRLLPLSVESGIGEIQRLL